MLWYVRALVLGLAVSCALAQNRPSQPVPVQVKQVLSRSCVPCHNANLASGKLRLDSPEAIVSGGAAGAAVVPGDSKGSNLYTRITATDPRLRMPPASAALPPDQIDIIRRWIDSGAPGLLAASSTTPKPEYKNVEAILRQACYPCHSGTRPRSLLRLDAKSTALKGGIGGVVIVPGNGDASRLVHRIEGRGGEPRMPLGGTPLKPEQIAAIRAWIDAGADWPDTSNAPVESLIETHWSYKKPVRPSVPRVRGETRNEIDSFVLAALEKRALTFSAPATRDKLIRRVSLDLTGIPPTPKEVAEFVTDARPDAYERLVDRLLASPRYGERWARPWLDYARYADTNGYEADFRRMMWKYRDWVINALNRNMPFDQFTIEQLAGDMLPEPTNEQRIATGFHRNTMYNEEGGVDRDQAHFEVLVDRVNTTSTVWLGSTIACSQCHNHKYDPFTQKQYYQLMAFFSSAAKKAIDKEGESKYEEPKLDLPTPEQRVERDSMKARIEQLEALLKTSTPELEASQRRWEQDVLRSASDWSTVVAHRLSAAAGTQLSGVAEGSILASEENPRQQTYTIEAAIERPTITAVRLEALPHPDLPRGGPGRDAYGNFVLSDLQFEVEINGGWRIVTFDERVADDGDVDDATSKQLWSIDASRDAKRVPRQMVLIPCEPVQVAAGSRVRITLKQNSELIGQALGHFRISVTGVSDPRQIVSVSAALRPVLQTDEAKRSGEDASKLAKHYRGVAPALTDARDELKRLEKELEDLPVVSALVIEDGAKGEQPFDFVRARGAFSAIGDKVQAGVPVVFGNLPPDQPANRLTFARWLVSRENPLTARVTVNRIWEQYFGRGIVETLEDFGSQGESPTHPELLDWLAVEFMERGWDLKAVHRLIVTSAAYQQTSAVTPKLLEVDPDNRLISRGPRMRLEAEMVRDFALAASGLLVEKIGGPSVFPPQPPGVWDLPYNDDQWEESTGSDKYRRALYTFIRRSAPYPALTNFDAPSREACTVRRTRSNTPLQALTTLNDVALFEAAQALGSRMLREGGTTDAARIDYGYRLVASRMPAPAESARMLAWQSEERAWFRRHPDEARKIAPTDSADPVEDAVWTMTGNVLLNLDESLTKE